MNFGLLKSFGRKTVPTAVLKKIGYSPSTKLYGLRMPRIAPGMRSKASSYNLNVLVKFSLSTTLNLTYSNFVWSSLFLHIFKPCNSRMEILLTKDF